MAVVQYRQGDILLVKLDRLPKGAVARADHGSVILAYGEATGHAHRIDARYATMYEWKEEHLIETQAGAKLEHEEHATIALEPGVFRVVRQREYAPDKIRFVRD